MCIMKMDEGVDTGDILAMEKISLTEELTYIELAKKMSHLGGQMLLKVLENIDNIKPIKQPVNGTYAKKITKEEALLDWNQDAEDLAAKVRAFVPWPGAFFNASGEQIKILKATYEKCEHNLAPGTIILTKKSFKIACKRNFFIPLELQRPGRKLVLAEEFLRGCPSLTLEKL